MNLRNVLGVIIGMTLVTTIAATPLLKQVEAKAIENGAQLKVPAAVSGEMCT
jgi:hypothetical protein